MWHVNAGTKIKGSLCHQNRKGPSSGAWMCSVGFMAICTLYINVFPTIVSRASQAAMNNEMLHLYYLPSL